MEIQSLRMRVPEQSVNALITEFLSEDYGVEKVRVRITADGIHVHGEYPTAFLRVPFEMHWKVELVRGQIQAKLESLNVSRMPAGMLRGVLMKMIRDHAKKHPGVQVGEDTVQLNLEAAAKAKGMDLKLNLTKLTWDAGHLMLEAGTGA
jgi:hypothetical protein